MLRRRAGVSGGGEQGNGGEDEVSEAGMSALAGPSSSGHINLFEDLEKVRRAPSPLSP